MKIYPKLISCFLLLVFLSGCKKSNSTEETSKPAPSTNAAPATTAPAASAPAATSSSADAAASAETTAKMAAAEWAIKQDEIKKDSNGQWAIQATASSAYNDAQGVAGFSANHATWAPNV
jgi:PBP1b-binding outer membrane lipoprotein LpoB